MKTNTTQPVQESVNQYAALSLQVSIDRARHLEQVRRGGKVVSK